jgi:hypothetical protein
MSVLFPSLRRAAPIASWHAASDVLIGFDLQIGVDFLLAFAIPMRAAEKPFDAHASSLRGGLENTANRADQLLPTLRLHMQLLASGGC